MDKVQTLSNLPPKGTYDWLPAEFAVRKYIFDTWRKVCLSFGYQEYLTPLVEYADIYRAKSGEDVGGAELTVFEDRGGRELAIRPEMTPSVTRMVTKIYQSSPKPIRLFSIANFYRNEKPQRGRNREFWQLNFDIFGSDNLTSDAEVLQMAVEIMLAFNPPAGSFTLKLNSRKLVNDFFNYYFRGKDLINVLRILDKFDKLTESELRARFNDENISQDIQDKLISFVSSNSLEEIKSNFPELISLEGFIEVETLIKFLEGLGYGEWIQFCPRALRGFDYYDGMVFEVFDNNPENARSMFGGGRYNGLASIFGSERFPAVGCAPGDETTKLFLESWNLLPKFEPNNYYFPLLDEALRENNLSLAKKFRQLGWSVTQGIEQEDISKALSYASKNKFAYTIISGSEESKSNTVKIKNMATGEQKTENFW